jgi:hypothetical protein
MPVFRRRAAADQPPVDEEVAPPAGGVTITLDYPVAPRSRFGHGLPTHSLLLERLRAGDDRYRARLEGIAALADDLATIPVHGEGLPEHEPRWWNGWIPGLDAAALYSLLVHERPRTYMEVGSGNSTSFARRSITDHDLPTKIVSIDPRPRAAIDAICDEVLRSPVEDVDLAVFELLQPGDVLFVDNSHRALQNSDATVLFMEVLPSLPAGVHVQFHDIFLPDDYPDAWNDRYYSEQYVLAAFVLGGDAVFDTHLPCWYVAHHASDLAAIVAPLFARLPGAERHGNSFWVVTKGR